MLLINPYRFKSSRFISNDADVDAYLNAVEAADGQELEAGVITAVEDFVLGCKSDGIWSAIKASCILAGARTLNGALVPLVGSAPTNYNFVSADYNRETGLKGNGSTKYLDSGRNNNADPQNSKHSSVYASEAISVGRYHMGATGFGATYMRLASGSLTQMQFLLYGSSQTLVNDANVVGFTALNRSNSTQIKARFSSATNTYNQNSTTPLDLAQTIFKGANQNIYGNPRLSFYSIGESLDLALLDTRVSNLMTDLAAAI